MEENPEHMTNQSHRAPRHLSAEVARDSRKLFVPLIVALAAALVLGAGIGTAFALGHKTATVIMDGKSAQMGTWGETVEDLLRENGVSFQDKDEVTPAKDTNVENGMTITVESSRGLTVKIAGKQQDVDTTADSASEAIQQQWADKAVEFIGTNGKDSQGQELPVLAPGEKYQLVHDGTTSQLKAAKGDVTPEDILQRNKVKLGALDETKVLFNPGAAPIVQVLRVTEETQELQEPIKFTTETTKDESKYADEKVVTQKGVDGVKKVTKKVRSVDGVVQSEKIVDETVVNEAVTEKITVGTKQRPASEPIAATGDVWSKLAFCESGGRPGTNTGNGFYGLYQFSLPTWQAVGGVGLPSDASPEEQTKRAQILQARSGWGQWPACSRKLGLR